MSVKCPKCRTENRDTQSFCGDCGTQLPQSPEGSLSKTQTQKTPSGKLEIGSVFAERYQILEELGKGGMGKVYRVKDKKLDEEIALKVLKPEIASHTETIERFKNELKLSRKIAHKHVCKMYDLNEEQGTLFITMEYVEGKDLRRYIRGKGRLAQDEALTIAKQVCEGLAGAHELKVIHRDLKSQNIMIDEMGNAKVMDFGLARSIDAPGVTQSGMMIGTPDYISPEQAEGEEADQRSDIYALGVILYEMVTGRVPFKGDTAFSVALKHKSKMPANPRELNPEVSEDLSRLILICMEKDREKRYQTAEALLSDLRNIEESTKPEMKIRTSRETFIKAGTRKKLLVPAVGLAIGVIALVIWRLSPRKQASQVVPVKPSIAVLPLEDLSPDDDESYFSEGIHDDILTQLTKIGDLKVIARTSVLQYKDTKKRISEIGEELGVNSILEGTVRRAGNRIRIGAQLIDAATEEHLWAESYDRELSDVFAIQSDIAQKIAVALKMTLTPDEKNTIEQKPTENVEAYNHYTKGNYYINNYYSQDAYEKAVQEFEKAVKLDPTFVLAYTKLATTNAFLYVPKTWDHTLERLEKCKAALEKAVALAPDLPVVHHTKGYYAEWIEKDFDQARAEYEIALSMRPNNSEFLYSMGTILMSQGKAEQAAEYFVKSHEVDPNSSDDLNMIGLSYILQREWEEAERWIDISIASHPESALGYYRKIEICVYGYGDLEKARSVVEEGSLLIENFDQVYYPAMIELYSRNYQEALTIRESSSWRPHYNHMSIGQLYDLMGDSEKARIHYRTAVELLEEMIDKQPENAFHYSSLGLALAGIGNGEEASKMGHKAVELRPIKSDPWSSGESILLDLAHINIILGEYEVALDHMETLLSYPTLLTRWRLKLDPIYDAIRSHPRFQILVSDR